MGAQPAQLSIDLSDADFDLIYPQQIRELTRKHWTPVPVAKAASHFLVRRRGVRVLDVGSGAGKFCMVGALHTRAHFTGVEQRLNLVELSQSLAAENNIDNLSYIHANITSINFADYDAFYMYNPFFENIDQDNRVDSVVYLNSEFYHDYSTCVFEQLSILPSGTRLATYFTDTAVIPPNFGLVTTSFKDNLKFWEKMH